MRYEDPSPLKEVDEYEFGDGEEKPTTSKGRKKPAAAAIEDKETKRIGKVPFYVKFSLEN
jgi:hypothetical protein